MAGDHVKESRRYMLALSVKERVKIVQQDIWIDCPQSILALRMIKNIVQSPQQIQAPCMLVCGEGGSGKTSIVRQLKLISRKWDEHVIFMALNENPGNLHFRELLLEAMGASHSTRHKVKPTLPTELAEFIALRRVRAIVIDEFHDALLSNRPEQLKVLSILKGLSGEPYCLSVIGLGTSLARNALRHDAQLLRRYYIHDLPKWTESEIFRSFLSAYEENLPLRKQSTLYSEALLKFLLINSNGVMDNVVKLIKHAAIIALVSGEEQITVDGLREAMSNPWAFQV